ncbi:ATP-dependent DNA helicase RecG [Sediminitomix flava]|uniref:ATP-dependent DNA helicase RecG n=1 Tax=Sediminitomix flava TaxID=379075 RepID=A0A315YWB4_SEDFL|nr:ATP-dependent DNA helicase RecG [Sediminitomix flava]PWJ34139.1 ATP-dependent DNA helicase RecG [Sediminitomix flava]
MVKNFFDTKIEFLKGVGPQKASLLNTELGIFTFGDLLEHFPFRHEDRTKFYRVSEIQEHFPYVQLKGRIVKKQYIGEGRGKRLSAQFQDDTGVLELVWFKGHSWIDKSLQIGATYVIFGKPQRFGFKFSISHPEMELVTAESKPQGGLFPVYHTSEKMKPKGLDSRGVAKLQRTLLKDAFAKIEETLPEYLLKQHNFISKAYAVGYAHFPKDPQTLEQALNRLKFEELFYMQLKVLAQKKQQHTKQFAGQVFAKIPTLNTFYKEHLPFDLTNAQKRVVREIYGDMKSGIQMNRLLQGDVGSGKTIVAFICMLMCLDNDAQACMMAPTEILATQHYHGLKEHADKIGVSIALLTGSSKTKERRIIDEELRNGKLKIIVGTHALIEEKVDFQNLGLCVIDEQHRFGVAQRAALWKKTSKAYPHILVMTATPIPRTLAMTVYGDLDVSVIDELPAGRKPIVTQHRTDANRLRVFGFIKEQIAEGRQAYVVYPLIEESEKLDYKNLMDGYESICRAFPKIPISIVHGRMKAEDKEWEMQRFVKGETKIMVATTVIEVGVNVPNSTVMVIENAEKFGLAQLHQLRGRVGRGGSQSYCILISGDKLSKDGKFRLETMVRTNNGFEIADADLKLRGPGDIEGTQQSGVLSLKFTDISKDSQVLQLARETADKLLDEDPKMEKSEHSIIRTQQAFMAQKKTTNWSRIS